MEIACMSSSSSALLWYRFDVFFDCFEGREEEK
jgi:hypothetical protein